MVWAATPSATLTWTAPTAYTDGTALPAADIDHYTIGWARTATDALMGQQAATGLTASIPIACGSVVFWVSASTGAAAKYPNQTSLPAGPVTYNSGIACVATKPNPPGGLTVH